MSFNGCFGTKILPQPLNCPELTVLDLPDKVWIDFTALGKTDVVDSNSSLDLSAMVDAIIKTRLANSKGFSIRNAMLMDVEIFTLLVDYIGELRTEIELYNNKVISLENNNTSKDVIK